MLATHDAGNDTTYGLAATVWTRDIEKVRRLIESLTAGTVWRLRAEGVVRRFAPRLLRRQVE